MGRRAAIIILDGVGIGSAPDAAEYGDTGSNTLGNLATAVGGFSLPNLERLGLGGCGKLAGLRLPEKPGAAYGTCQPASKGKDSTAGHWELCGLMLDRPFPTYPNGFPEEVIGAFAQLTGRRVVANKPASGTAILDEFGEHHLKTGDWIVYTSADSVFQVAAHEDKIPLKELYAACETARDMLKAPHDVSRVIARPFTGRPGAWIRTARRRDYSIAPPGPTLLDHLHDRHIPRLGIGKVDDLFAGRHITSVHTATNAEAYRMIRDGLRDMQRGLLFANVIEFDQAWGHRNDTAGFHQGLRELDQVLPELLGAVREEDLVIFTADHGNDPTTPSTDHSREVVPLLVYGPRVRAVPLGSRRTFADVGQTVAEFLGAAPLAAGTSFLDEVWAN
jgi:phosphopentomutase